jgi:hypothetical protein
VITGAPDETPVTTPTLFTVASPGLLLLHVPPDGDELSDVVKPTHTCRVPMIAEGIVFTVNGVVIKQPVGNV